MSQFANTLESLKNGYCACVITENAKSGHVRAWFSHAAPLDCSLPNPDERRRLLHSVTIEDGFNFLLYEELDRNTYLYVYLRPYRWQEDIRPITRTPPELEITASISLYDLTRRQQLTTFPAITLVVNEQGEAL